jgi:hypothetical protein
MTALDTLIVLHSVSKKLATKEFTWIEGKKGNPGKIRNKSFGRETYFAVEEIPLGSAPDLFRHLDRLTANPYAFIIRGAPRPGINRRHTRRLLHKDPQSGDGPCFAGQPRQWLLVDCDHLLAPALTDLVNRPADAVEHVIGHLPPEFQDVSCFWQLSASAGLPASEGFLSLHLWYWCARGYSDDELTRLANFINRDERILDAAVYRAVQPHYIAAPRFIGMPDPLPIRHGIRQGLEDELELIIPPADDKNPEKIAAGGYEPRQGVRYYLDCIGGPDGFRAPIFRAISSYIAEHGRKVDLAPLYRLIRQTLDRVDPGWRGDPKGCRYADDDHLDKMADWIRLQHGDQPPKGFIPPVPARLDEVPPPEPDEPTGDAIQTLNKTFAVIRVVNKVAILNEHLDAEGRPTFSLLSKDSFTLLLANQKIKFPTASNDAATAIPLANYWLANPRRRQHEGIAFAPQGAPRGYYNLWTGLAVKPNKSGSCAAFKEHLYNNVCNDNPAIFDWVFGWFADIFQNPAHKCGTSLVLRGEMGVGKTIVGETFGHLLGLHYVQVADPRYVTGRFNAHLVRCLLFHLDEAFWAGDRIAESKVKDLVTGKRHPIELKGYEAFFVPNYIRLFINGNPDWLVPAGPGERRFTTLDVAPTHKEDIAYFRAIADELRDGGYQRLLYELLEFDLATVDLRHIPKTEALLDQKIASLSPEQGWWIDILKRGQLPHHTRDAQPGRCPGQMLYDDYIKHAKEQGARRRAIETAIGIFLNKNVPGLASDVKTYTIKDATNFESASSSRGTVYIFPPLPECRRAFEEKLHQAVTWPVIHEWIGPD